MSDKPEQTEPTPEEFEEFVAAALKVDPKGLSGKHRHPVDEPPDAEQPDH